MGSTRAACLFPPNFNHTLDGANSTCQNRHQNMQQIPRDYKLERSVLGPVYTLSLSSRRPSKQHGLSPIYRVSGCGAAQSTQRRRRRQQQLPPKHPPRHPTLERRGLIELERRPQIFFGQGHPVRRRGRTGPWHCALLRFLVQSGRGSACNAGRWVAIPWARSWRWD